MLIIVTFYILHLTNHTVIVDIVPTLGDDEDQGVGKEANKGICRWQRRKHTL